VNISSRDVALVIVFAAVVTVFRFLIGRFVGMMSIITFPGLIYTLSIFYAIVQSASFLLFRGRRWRFLSLGLLSTLLFFIFVSPVFRPNEMAILLNYFVIDVVFNSFYGSFEQKNRLLWLTIIFQLYYWIAYAFWILFFNAALFYPFEQFLNNWFIPVMSVSLPVMIVEAVAGGYIGYKIYRRVEKLA
jgi:hypothetical protein